MIATRLPIIAAVAAASAVATVLGAGLASPDARIERSFSAALGGKDPGSRPDGVYDHDAALLHFSSLQAETSTVGPAAARVGETFGLVGSNGHRYLYVVTEVSPLRLSQPAVAVAGQELVLVTARATGDDHTDVLRFLVERKPETVLPAAQPRAL